MFEGKFKCIKLLKKFDGKELEGLRDLVICRYFNQDKYVIQLLDVLKSEVLQREDFDVDLYEKVYEKVFVEKIDLENVKDAATKKAKFNNKLNTLLRLAKRFLAIEALEQNPAYRDDLMCQKILEKRQFGLFEQHIKRAEKEIDKSAEDKTYYHHKYILEQNRLNYLYRTEQLTKQDNLEELIEYADKAFVANKLGFYITLLSLRVKQRNEYDVSSMKATEALLDMGKHKERPYMILSKAAVALAKEPSRAAYEYLLKLLETHASSITKKGLIDFYMVAFNFTQRIGYKESLRICKIMDAENLLVEDNFIPPNRLKQVIHVASRAEEFNWAKQTLEKYKTFIKKKEAREAVYQFNMGVIAFNKGEYHIAAKYFEYDPKDVNDTYPLQWRIIRLKNLYELDEEFENFTLGVMQSTRKYFGNKKDKNKKDKAYKNFMDILIGLYGIRYDRDKMNPKKVDDKLKNLKRLNVKLEAQKVNADKKWLLKKIEELRKKLTE